MFFLLTGLIGLYVIARTIPYLPWQKPWKILAALTLLLISLEHLISHTLYGSLASPEAPFAVAVAQGWLFGALVLLATFLLLLDIATVVQWSAKRIAAIPTPRISRYRLLAGIYAVALTLSAAGVWQALQIPEVRTVEITLPNLPAEMDGLRLAQISDLHASRVFEENWVQSVVDKTNALKPDLILLTGDVIDGSPEARANDVVPLKQLEARLGVFAIPGNHEYYSGYEQWMREFDHLGLRMLLNQHVVITENGFSLVLAGLTDRTAERFGEATPDIAKALTGAPKNAPLILMDHQPREAKNNSQAGVDLQLSGHTHGGQIIGIHWLTQWANKGYVSGLYQIGRMQLYVSNCAGLWPGLPLRLGRPSEITLIILRAS